MRLETIKRGGHEGSGAPTDGANTAPSTKYGHATETLPARRVANWRAVGALCLSSGLAFAAPIAAQTTTGTQAGTSSTSSTSGQTTGQAGQPTVPDAAQAATPPQAAGTPASDTKVPPVEPTVPPLQQNLTDYTGQRITAIRYVGVDFDKSDRLTSELTLKVGEPLDPGKVQQTTRRLFATGRYRNIAVRVEKANDGLTIIFSGVPRYYIGRVQINGIREDRLSSLLEYGSELNPGTAFTNTQVTSAIDAVKQVLAQNGYFEPKIAVVTTRDDAGNQVDITFTIAVGPKARVGNVTITGKDPGITLAVFRKKGKLKKKTKVERETTSNALSALRAYYQKKNRLEATVSLTKSTYDAPTRSINYDFTVEQGPVVEVKVDGATLSKSRLHLLVPVYEEGTVDNDLLNEGSFNMKDYLQQQGYFDAKVTVKAPEPATDAQTVLYTVDKGEKHKVISVVVKGNKYFGSELLTDRLKIQKADAYQRAGKYSAELVKADQNGIESLYRANGFKDAKVTSSVVDAETAKGGKKDKIATISVVYTIVEGSQQKFGAVGFKGVADTRQQAVQGLLQAAPGQPFSLITLSGDRDAILSYYLSNGFDEAKVEVAQTQEKDAPLTDIGFNVTEGPQVFTGKVLESGRYHTKQTVIDGQVKVKAGDPLDQSALLETQRNLYNLALFNEVVATVQNPAGDAEQKNVLLQLTEAKRWDVTYGFGFEAQTGIPTCGMYCTQRGTTAAQQGKAGVSPRVSIDVSRINLFGTQDSLTLHGTYGLLEEVALLTFQNPHPFGSNRFAFQVSGGYSNVQNIQTFASSTLSGDVRVTHKATKKDTFIYDFEYRRVAVDPNSLEIAPDLIPILSEPVLVAGPSITWFHDTRSPSPLDASKGSYTSVVNFWASSKLGSGTDFDRVDVSNSTYYQFGKKKYVLARNTRFGMIGNYGSNPNAGNLACTGTLINTNASCNPTPLPERLYAGGATSIRGFGINDAGPRDLQTGYPVGGSGVFINTVELRLPAPTLPYVGDSIAFVLFHDMGNVFQHVGDVFPSIGRFHQPDQAACRNLGGTIVPPAIVPQPIGNCNFNYFSHDIGLGVRYKTPVGPIRLDLSYNLNPPIYPQFPGLNAAGDYVNNQVPSVGQAGHFNFFFSIGQSF